MSDEKEVTCGECALGEAVYLSAYDGVGMFEAWACRENIVCPKIVDKTVSRKCLSFCTERKPLFEAKTA